VSSLELNDEALKQDEITKRQIEELVHNKVGKFVKEAFKNELTQRNIESIEQHKYARLSKGSYMR
jgi:transcriptional regulator of met regulon